MCVREREVTGYHSTPTQTILFLCIAMAGCYISKASKGASSRQKKMLLQLPKELKSGIEIVHGWFMERGDSILSVLGGELLRV